MKRRAPSAESRVWWGVLFHALSVILAVAPTMVWLYINRVKYFTPRTTESMAAGTIFGLIFLVLVLVGAFKNMSKGLTITVFTAVALGLVWFLEPLMADLFWIILCILIGDILFWPTHAIAKRSIKFYNSYKEEKVRVEARREANRDFHRDTNEVFM